MKRMLFVVALVALGSTLCLSQAFSAELSRGELIKAMQIEFVDPTQESLLARRINNF